MTKAMRIHEPGGPEAMVYEDVDVGEPGEGEIRLKQSAIGLNFIDISHRSGLYPLPSMPATIGVEGAGKVTAVGDGVEDFKEGDRVAYTAVPPGAYAEERLIKAAQVVPVPDEISDEEAAAVMLQGLTAQFLLKRIADLEAGDTVLIHAAAGGTGTVLVQWAKHLGLTVIGTVGSDQKAMLAKENGAHHVINYNEDKVSEKVREITEDKGVVAVFDAVGKALYEDNLDSLGPMGWFIHFGNASGLVDAVNPMDLMQRGSLKFTRPMLFHYIAKREDMLAGAKDLFEVMKHGHVKVAINQKYDLKDAGQAHEDLKNRKTTGKSILIP